MAIAGLYKIFDHWHAQGTVWIYSDPHFSDKELAAGQVHRPAVAEQIENINRKVGRKDTLIILGDVGDIEAARKLRGYKILIMGNHDSGRTNYEGVFDEVYEGPLMISEKLILSHEPVDIPWAFNIHGHVHSQNHKNDKRHFNVCAEAINFTPINFNQWMKQGHFSRIKTIHRSTIDRAMARKPKEEERSSMFKYYMIKTYTCYCGEYMYHYLKIEDDETIENPKYMDIIYEWVGNDAYEWWDDDTAAEFDGEYDAYLAECGYDIYEITKEEYEVDCGKE